MSYLDHTNEIYRLVEAMIKQVTTYYVPEEDPVDLAYYRWQLVVLEALKDGMDGKKESLLDRWELGTENGHFVSRSADDTE